LKSYLIKVQKAFVKVHLSEHKAEAVLKILL